MSDTITFSPIAFVQSRFKHNTSVQEMRTQPAQLVVKPEFKLGLMGLKVGDDILVLFNFHRIKAEEIELQLHPGHNPTNPVRGVFATRTQFRPNKLGATIARIEKIEDNIITVTGLDAQDGAPVLDIKPYTPYFDNDTRRQQLEVQEVASLPEARHAIDLIDAEIIRLLGNRASYVRQVVNFKKNVEEVRAPARYREVMHTRREMAKEAGLNPDVIEQVYKLLVDNFIEEELEILRQREKTLKI